MNLTSLLTSGLKSKIRLWIEYALILAVVVLLGLAAWGKIKTARLETQVASLSGKLDGANSRIAEVEGVNKAQAEAIATVQQMRQLDAAVLTGLSNALEAATNTDRNVRSRLATLEKSNEAVRAYLAGAVPDPVGCVLDRTCEAPAPAASVPRPARAAPADVRRPGAGAVKNKR